jgi:hypothetical protein
MSRRWTQFWMLALVGLGLAMTAYSDDQARIPYNLVCEIQRSQAKVSQTHTNLQIVLRIRSTQPEVTPGDVRVYIDSKDGAIPVKLDGEGNFSVPIRDSLVAENPWLIVNQPKGTMKLEWNVGIVGIHPTNGMHYRELMQPLVEVQSIAQEMAQGGSKLSIRGLKLVFAKDKETTVVIHSKHGDRVFKTSLNHSLIVPMEKALMDEDPQIVLPAEPERSEVVGQD